MKMQHSPQSENIISSVRLTSVVAEQCSRPAVSEPPGWSDDDKRQFLIALRNYGDSNLETLQLEMPQKSIIDIRNIVEYYKKKAQSKWVNNENRMCDEVKKWIDIIDKIRCKRQGFLHDLIPRALKYIAMFEKKTKESDIDLSEAYSFLSELSYGKPTKELPERTGYFLYQCLVKLAENLQKQDLEETQLYLKELKNFEDLVAKADESMINPLGIPDNLLELNSVDTSDDITQ